MIRQEGLSLKTDGDPKARFRILAILTRLRRLCCASELVKSFQSGKADFFLISLKAGGVGLTLTEADYVILPDPWWNPAVENQAADRSHRIGRKNPVTVYRLVCSDTVEEKVLAIHEEKKALFDTLINDSSNAGPLSPSELIELMR
ncbi:MAG: C-terminal helicase domain-containing protein [Akkermansia muciniphila]|nr:C-terminal helicase domain-containing protein [Akkermansia muciniphila]